METLNNYLILPQKIIPQQNDDPPELLNFPQTYFPQNVFSGHIYFWENYVSYLFRFLKVPICVTLLAANQTTIHKKQFPQNENPPVLFNFRQNMFSPK